jgi:molybdopterin-binding protein
MNDISACNRIEGTVAFIKKGKATANLRMTSAIGDVTLVVTSSSVEALNLEVGDQVAALFREVDVMLMKGQGSMISTNNRFAGTVRDMKQGGVTVEVPLEVEGGSMIVAVVARTAAEEMGLAIGDTVMACIREGDLLLTKGGALSIRNSFQGTITGLRPGTVTTEITLDTGNGEIHALLAKSIAEEMGLAAGDRVSALVRERDFLIQR